MSEGRATDRTPLPRGTAPPRLRANRPYVLYLSGTTATWAGMGVADVLLLWLVFFETGSTLAVAAVGLAEAVPPIAFGFLAGLLADRTDRRRLVAFTALLQAVVLALVPISLWAFGFHLLLVLVLVLVLETVTVASQPSSTAVLPSLVGSDSLDAANALAQGFISVATTLGAALAAVLLVVLGTLASFGLNAGVFLLAAILLFLIVIPRAATPPGAVPKAPRPLREDLVDVVRFLRGHPWLFDLTLVSVAAGFFVMMFSPYLVVYTVRTLHLPASVFGFLAAGYGAGFFVGSLVTPRLRLVRTFGAFFVLALVGSGALLGFLVLVPVFLPALAGLAALGILMGMVLTGFVTLAQRAVPPELLGRYLGLEQSLAWAVAPLGILAGGLVTQIYGIQDGFAIAGLGLGIVGLIALSSRRVRAAGYVPGDGVLYSVPAGALLSPAPRPPLEPSRVD